MRQNYKYAAFCMWCYQNWLQKNTKSRSIIPKMVWLCVRWCICYVVLCASREREKENRKCLIKNIKFDKGQINSHVNIKIKQIFRWNKHRRIWCAHTFEYDIFGMHDVFFFSLSNSWDREKKRRDASARDSEIRSLKSKSSSLNWNCSLIEPIELQHHYIFIHMVFIW